MMSNHVNHSASRWFYNARISYETYGLNENAILSHFPALKDYFNNFLSEIAYDSKRIWAQRGSANRFEESFANSSIIPIRSKATELVSLETIMSSCDVESRESMWFLPTLVQRPDFQQRIPYIVRSITEHDNNRDSRIYKPLVPLFGFFIKAYCPAEVFEEFTNECGSLFNIEDINDINIETIKASISSSLEVSYDNISNSIPPFANIATTGNLFRVLS